MDAYWHGKKVTDLSREELIEIINWLGREYHELMSPDNIHARALGKVEMMKRKPPSARC
jgi:hypothetical protein